MSLTKFQFLTSTQSSLRVSSSPQMAAQPLNVIARFCGAAVLIKLPSANLTAAAAVGDPADTQWTRWGRGRAGALSWALTLCLGNGIRGQIMVGDGDFER